MPVKAPFYSNVPRFGRLGLYPTLDPNMTKENNLNVAPNTYYPNHTLCKSVITKSPWTRKNEIEEYSKTIGYRSDLLAEIDYMRSHLGPGHYNLMCPRKLKLRRKTGFGTSERHNPIKEGVPPCDYNKDIYKSSSVNKKMMTKVPPLEWDGFKNRLEPDTKSWHLPSNIYHPKDYGSIEELMKKVVSTRGPYDLFTGKRDNSTIKNHFTYNPAEGADQFYDMPSHLDILLQHPLKKHCGCFAKLKTQKLFCDQTHSHVEKCYEKPETPGPTSYEINWHIIKGKPRSDIPFNSTSFSKPAAAIAPGPGRYNIHYKRCILRKRKMYKYGSVASGGSDRSYTRRKSSAEHDAKGRHGKGKHSRGRGRRKSVQSRGSRASDAGRRGSVRRKSIGSRRASRSH